MKRTKDFEIANAREWDEVSNAPSEQPPLPIPQNIGLPVPSAFNGNGAAQGAIPRPNANLAQRNPASVSPKKPVQQHERSHTSASSASPVKFNLGQPPPAQTHQRPRGVLGQGQEQSRGRGRPPPRSQTQTDQAKTKWASPPKLMTNRRADAIEERDAKKHDNEQYLRAPDRDEQFPAIGYYIWPSNADSPADMLGQHLEELNAVRVEHKIFIEMNEENDCIKICCRATEDSEYRIQFAIRAIRQVIRHNHAAKILARPTYIMIPPTASAITAIVRPTSVSLKPHEVTGLELAGDKLSEDKKLEWKNQRSERLQACRKKFEEAMTKGLKALAPYKGWMQMRLRFGHIILHDSKVRFRKGNSSWQDFLDMMSYERMESTLDKNFGDARVVMGLRQKIIQWPERFRPAVGKYASMIFVPFKDTEIIFFDTPSRSLRIEAEIDKLAETYEGEYQVGSIRLFPDNNRNQRMRVTTIDVEKKIDWEVVIISDNEILDIPNQLLTMIQQSVTTQSPVYYDSLGLPYPGVAPVACSDVNITTIAVKSVIQYAVSDSGYIVEMTIIRTWPGSDMSGEPEVSASVSMYHPEWDNEMVSLIDTTRARSWGDPLRRFFGVSSSNDEREDSRGGVEGFTAEVETIQGFLVDATKQAELRK